MEQIVRARVLEVQQLLVLWMALVMMEQQGLVIVVVHLGTMV
jgi:hypothetical protein